MLFCDSTSAGGNCASDDKNLSGSCSPCPDHEGAPQTAPVLDSASIAPDSERGTERESPDGPCPGGSATDHPASPPSDTPSLPATDTELRRGATVGCSDHLLLWAGEITVPAVSAFDPAVHLSWGDVSISGEHQVVRVVLKRSKTDQFGRGTQVYLGSTSDELCPVRAVQSYVAMRGTSPGAFSCSAEGTPLTKARFVELVRLALARVGVPLSGYSGHSFRIGAATAASQAGIPDSVIQALGRWSSSAFLRYIRPPREQLAQFSHPLAHRS